MDETKSPQQKAADTRTRNAAKAAKTSAPADESFMDRAIREENKRAEGETATATKTAPTVPERAKLDAKKTLADIKAAEEKRAVETEKSRSSNGRAADPVRAAISKEVDTGTLGTQLVKLVTGALKAAKTIDGARGDERAAAVKEVGQRVARAYRLINESKK